MSELIGGLCNDVAISSLACIPFCHYRRLELVSRSWRAAIRSPELIIARQQVGLSEDFLCVCALDQERENLWQLYDPLQDLWITLAVPPLEIRHLSHFGAVSTAGKLFVIGGATDQDGFFLTDEVWSYQPVVRQWARCRAMLAPRSMFACCVLNGKIVVAGGFTGLGESTTRAEMYDPEADRWIRLPDLLYRTDNSGCSGVVIGGKVHVLHNGMSKVQVLDNAGAGWTDEEWGQPLRGPMAVVGDALYAISHGDVIKQDKEVTTVVGSASEFRKRIGFAMIGLGDELYVIGGSSFPDVRSNYYQPLSVVDVLKLGTETPTWRLAASMRRCAGPIRVCTLLRI